MKKNILSMAVLLMASAAVFTACSSDDNITSEQPANPTGKYTMTVQASKDGDATTRALTLGRNDADTKNVLNATWAAGEKVTVYNVTRSAALDGYLEVQSAGTSTTLKGSLTGTIEAGDELRLSFLNPIYSAQNGTLAYIASNCDYAEATVTVASVDGGDITTAADANFANQQAIVKFRLKDAEGNNLNASSLTIAAASNRLLKGQFRNTPETKHTGYTVTAGTGGFNASESHTSLLDGNKGTKWCSNSGTWNVTFETASPVQVDGYTLTTGGDTQSESGRNPKNWTLKGKLNESDPWTTIAAVTDDNTMPAANTTDVDFVVDNPGSYQYFYFEVTANKGGDIMQLAELQLWKASDATAPIYGPITITPASATNELTVALHNANGADTYTLTANVGGQNYTFEKSGVNFVDGKYYEITVKMAAPDPTVTLTPGQIGDLSTNGTSYKTINGITISVSGDAHFYNYGTTGNMDVHGDIGPEDYESVAFGSFTFTTTSNRKIKRIDINHESGRWSGAGTGWPDSYEVYSNGTFTWSSGTPVYSVTLNGSHNWMSYGSLINVTSIVFTLDK
jgi:hypothetical protein